MVPSLRGMFLAVWMKSEWGFDDSEALNWSQNSSEVISRMAFYILMFCSCMCLILLTPGDYTSGNELPAISK